MPQMSVILPAGGRSERFGENKLLANLGSKPVIAHSLAAFVGRADVVEIIVPTGNESEIRQAIQTVLTEGNQKKVIFCKAGPNRAESVRNALACVSEKSDWVAVHDAARPLVSQQLISRTFALAQQHRAAAPALPVHLTIKQIDSSSANSLPARIERTIPRQQLYAMQTPQILKRSDLQTAFAKCPIPLAGVTDDLQLLELIGIETWLAPGDERNLKITHKTDLLLAEAILKNFAES